MKRSGKPSGIVVYLDCELCGRAFTPHGAKPGKPVKLERPVCCPTCGQERDPAAEHLSPSSARERTLFRKARESMDAVARRLKG